MRLLGYLLLLHVFLVICYAKDWHCMPNNASCWPSLASWNAFNLTVDGTLLVPVPPLKPCWTDPTSDECKNIISLYTDARWRSDQPGATQQPNWEMNGDEGCINSNFPCTQGAIPVYAVATQNADQVQKAVTFAVRHNLKLVVRSTGHSFLGRSTAPGSFMVWLHKMKGTTFIDNFNICGQDKGSAVKVLGGTQWEGVYREANTRGVVVVGGNAQTVGAAGGYVLGGGHGSLAPSYGLAVDNVLRFDVVTADGKLVTASSCENEDLFWALRGGGGGTFGVVTSVTYKTHKAPPRFATVNVQITPLTKDAYLEFFKYFMEFTGTVLEGKWSSHFAGWHYYTPSNIQIYCMFVGTESVATKIWAPFKAWVQRTSGLTLVYQSIKGFDTWLDQHGVKSTDSTGTCGALTSRLLPVENFLDEVKRNNTADAIIEILSTIGFYETNYVGGGAIRTNDPHHNETSVTPAWRNALWHATTAKSWPGNTSAAVIEQLKKVVYQSGQLLRNVAPDSGAYFNEADYLEPDWQNSFWGEENYKRLLEVKNKVDPDRVFDCWHCVGSELSAHNAP